MQDAGFEAYIVGGGVRDQLLNLHPKDFDVATNAHPEEIKKCFKRALIIGRRFRLVHVYFNRYDFVEVATFRKEQTSVGKNGMIARDNLFGSFEQDAFRRDFTVNALYYDPTHQKIFDFMQGMEDLKHKVLRLIGKPSVRLQEDPVRILRALRISNKIGFVIDEVTLKTIPKMIPLLAHVAGGRLFDEYQKLFLHGEGGKNFVSLQEWGILPYLFPMLPQALQDRKAAKMVNAALRNTDERCKTGKTINPGFLIAVFLWHSLHTHQAILAKSCSKREAYLKAVKEVLKTQTTITNMPGHFVEMIEQVWALQRLLEQRHPSKVLGLLASNRYRAAYDFLLLRAEIGEVKSDLPKWWDQLYKMQEPERLKFLGLPAQVDRDHAAH